MNENEFIKKPLPKKPDPKDKSLSFEEFMRQAAEYLGAMAENVERYTEFLNKEKNHSNE